MISRLFKAKKGASIRVVNITSNVRSASLDCLYGSRCGAVFKLKFMSVSIYNTSQELNGKILTMMRRLGNLSWSCLRVGRKASSRVVPSGAKASRTSP